MFKIQQLRIIAAIGEAGSLSAAAERVGLTQPALSKCIKEMERKVGTDLMVRNSRGVTLTDHGLSVAKRAATVARELDRLAEEFSWLRGKITGELAIGLTALGASPFLARAIGTFRAAYPEVRISINELRSYQIVDQLRSGELHCGILTTYGAQQPEKLDYHPIQQFEVATARGGSHNPLATLDDLLDLEWIDSNPDDFEESYIATLSRDLRTRRPRKVSHCSSSRLGVMLAVEFGAVCHFAHEAVPSFQQDIVEGRLTVLQLDRKLPVMKLGLVHPDRETLSPATREFARIVKLTRF